MKVYCYNCKHYRTGFSDREYHNCLAPENINTDSFYKPGGMSHDAPELNKNNDCKWWKKRE